jgi:hypothetical protein
MVGISGIVAYGLQFGKSDGIGANINNDNTS